MKKYYDKDPHEWPVIQEWLDNDAYSDIKGAYNAMLEALETNISNRNGRALAIAKTHLETALMFAFQGCIQIEEEEVETTNPEVYATSAPVSPWWNKERLDAYYRDKAQDHKVNPVAGGSENELS
jgi:hypothetical protein